MEFLVCSVFTSVCWLVNFGTNSDPGLLVDDFINIARYQKIAILMSIPSKLIHESQLKKQVYLSHDRL